MYQLQESYRVKVCKGLSTGVPTQPLHYPKTTLYLVKGYLGCWWSNAFCCVFVCLCVCMRACRSDVNALVQEIISREPLVHGKAEQLSQLITSESSPQLRLDLAWPWFPGKTSTLAGPVPLPGLGLSSPCVLCE